MKLPIIRHVSKESVAHDIDSAIKVLEIYSEAPGVKEEEFDLIAEMISNLSGAIEVKAMIERGVLEKDAANQFMKKVLSSIDK
jgi:Mrp family chromosome partitioning ATPase